MEDLSCPAIKMYELCGVGGLETGQEPQVGQESQASPKIPTALMDYFKSGEHKKCPIFYNLHDYVLHVKNHPNDICNSIGQINAMWNIKPIKRDLMESDGIIVSVWEGVSNYFQDLANWISLTLDIFVVPSILFGLSITSKKAFKFLLDSRRWYIMTKNPSFNLNIALNNEVKPVSFEELHSKILYSLHSIVENEISDYGEVLRFEKQFDTFYTFVDISLHCSENDLPEDIDETDEEMMLYDSISILVDISEVKLSSIKTVLMRTQSFILNELINKIKRELTIYSDIKNEDITIHFKETPNVLQSFKGFDIKEIVGNYESFKIKAFENKLVISGNIKDGTIEKIYDLIRANLVN